MHEQAVLFDKLAERDRLYEYAPDSLQRLDALVPAKRRLLDVGCGDGTIGSALTADRIVGFDISPKCAALSKRRGVRAVVADGMGALPFCNNAFDTVYCIDVLHHIGPNWEPIMSELNRVLTPGGTIAIVEPDARNPFVRLTQAPDSPIRVAPFHDEPAIDPGQLLAILDSLGFNSTCNPIHIEGNQLVRSVFPMWQRIAKAPFTLALAFWYRGMPNKFAIIARKPD